MNEYKGDDEERVQLTSREAVIRYKAMQDEMARSPLDPHSELKKVRFLTLSVGCDSPIDRFVYRYIWLSIWPSR